MSKSIKLKNDIYFDSKGIQAKVITPIINTDYVYSSDLDICCFKLNNIAIIKINTIAFKSEIPNFDIIMSNLPKCKSPDCISYLYARHCNNQEAVRVRINSSGQMVKHYSAEPYYGSSANYQYSGLFIYETID